MTRQIGDVVVDAIDRGFDALVDLECWIIGLAAGARAAWQRHRAPRAVAWGGRRQDYQLGSPLDFAIARRRRRQAAQRRAITEIGRRIGIAFHDVARSIRRCDEALQRNGTSLAELARRAEARR